MTESSYINSLANSPYRSTIKTLPATLPEPWTMVRGPRPKQKGPWSTDLQPRIVDNLSRFKLRGSRLGGAGPGLLGLVDGSESNWVEGWGLCLEVVLPRTSGGDGWVEVKANNRLPLCKLSTLRSNRMSTMILRMTKKSAI